MTCPQPDSKACTDRTGCPRCPWCGECDQRHVIGNDCSTPTTAALAAREETDRG